MSKYLYTNNAATTLAAGVPAGDLSLTVQTGAGALFPNPGAGEHFMVTLIDSSSNYEIIQVTARATDTFTIVRAQEGTSAQGFSLGDKVELRVTAGGLGNNLQAEDIGVSVQAYDADTVSVAPGSSGNILTSNGSAWTSAAPTASGGFPSGTLMLFQQTSAPTGWTKQTTHDDKTLRVVSGTAGSGGNHAFSTVFGKTASDGHTLTTSQIALHGHPYYAYTAYSGGIGGVNEENDKGSGVVRAAYTGAASHLMGQKIGGAGGGGSHSHGMDIRVQYVDLIIASKDA